MFETPEQDNNRSDFLALRGCQLCCRMSSASAVISFGRGVGQGRIERGPTHTIYAIHFSRPCLVTEKSLNSSGEPTDTVDVMILDPWPRTRATTTAAMMLAQLAGGESQILLYPSDTLAKDESGEILRSALETDVKDALVAAGPITMHITRFDHELFGTQTVQALRDLGIIVETFDSNEQPADPNREWTLSEA